MEDLINEAARLIVQSRVTLALTGAGISVESGIPDFRSAGGLWSKYDPAEYATIQAFRQDPRRVWNMLRDMNDLVSSAKPNDAHLSMGKLEQMGFLHHVITQNVDNLHQAGGSKNVIEYHGNASMLSCLQCGDRYTMAEKQGEHPPVCGCGYVLKPDVVFFGETIPHEAMTRSFLLASSAEVLMVVGTSAVVSPANTIPLTAKQNGAKLIEINEERTHLTETAIDVFIQGSAGRIMKGLAGAVGRMAESETSI